MLKDVTNLRGDLKITVWDEFGNVKEEKEETNLLVATGLNWICNRMEAGTEDVMSHMALGAGTTAPASGNTDLESLLGAREVLDSTTVTDNSIVYVCTFEPGDATGAVTEAGIFNASTSGTMLCRTTFDVVNKQANDTMGITWTITLNAA